MTNIDEATGLPELPRDDLFWRVTQTSVEIWRNLPDTEWVVDYHDGWPSLDFDPSSTERIERRTDETKLVTPGRKKFWGGNHPDKVDIRKTRLKRYVDRKNRVIQVMTEKTGTERTSPYWERGYYSAYTSIPGRMIPGREYPVYKHIAKEDIVPLALVALELYHSKQLIGDYPPKKLES